MVMDGARVDVLIGIARILFAIVRISRWVRWFRLRRASLADIMAGHHVSIVAALSKCHAQEVFFLGLAHGNPPPQGRRLPDFPDFVLSGGLHSVANLCYPDFSGCHSVANLCYLDFSG